MVNRAEQNWPEDSVIVVETEQAEVLSYVAVLKGQPTRELVKEILEDWLINSYVDEVAPAEKERGLPSSIVIDKKGNLNERASYQIMHANFQRL